MGTFHLKRLAYSAIAMFACTSAMGGVSAEGDKDKIAGVNGEKKTPLVVFIESRECPVCARVRPIMKELSEKYEPRVQFVNLDVTDDKAKAESKQVAKTLHVAAFFNMYSDTFPCVGIFDSKIKPVHEVCGFNGKEKYEAYIKRTLEN
jgi:thiol-disulfide isomerase/thioredoxin